MNAKKFFQLILIVVIVVGSFATTSAAFAASTCNTNYTVINGDTLRKIAEKCDTTVYALRRANPEIGSGNLIYPGQTLLLPGALIYGNNDGFNTYIVARGDTLKALAARFATTMDYLLTLNPEITDANIIYEGQRLLYPANGGSNPNPVPNGHSYIVQRGDTLKKISVWTFTTVEAILKINPQISNANLIYVGQVINLPSAVSSYTVQKGDTLKKIATKFGTTTTSLASLNRLSDPDKIYTGQVIRIW